MMNTTEVEFETVLPDVGAVYIHANYHWEIVHDVDPDVMPKLVSTFTIEEAFPVKADNLLDFDKPFHALPCSWKTALVELIAEAAENEWERLRSEPWQN